MPGMLPGMQALIHINHICQAAVLHVLLPVQLCVIGANESGPPAQGGGALVVGTAEVPLPGGSTFLGLVQR